MNSTSFLVVSLCFVLSACSSVVQKVPFLVDKWGELDNPGETNALYSAPSKPRTLQKRLAMSFSFVGVISGNSTCEQYLLFSSSVLQSVDALAGCAWGNTPPKVADSHKAVAGFEVAIDFRAH